jgi:hypothetical protein
MQRLVLYILKEDYFNLMADYIKELASWVPASLQIFDDFFNVKIVGVQLEQKLYHSFLLLDLTSERVISGKQAREFRRMFGPNPSDMNPDATQFSIKTIDGRQCLTVSSWCMVIKATIEKGQVDDSVVSDEHIYSMDFQISVKQSAHFEIKKEK